MWTKCYRNKKMHVFISSVMVMWPINSASAFSIFSLFLQICGSSFGLKAIKHGLSLHS